MCGILAMVSSESKVTELPVLSALRAMNHRGPDHKGVWCSPDSRVGLGSARLSIIDLETGAQPISNHDDTVVVVVNGEFYGFEAIRKTLQEQGHQFKTGSDSEIVLHLYERYGIQCLKFLRGEFAFALWDQRNGRLFAARDRFGIKPLVYAHHDNALVLASEAKALFAAGVPAGWSANGFFHAASHQYLPPSYTLFAGVNQLPPGHFLIRESGATRVEKYWDMDCPEEGEELHPETPEELSRELWARLDEAVSLRLRADVPVACYLSGGLDSSAIVGLAAKHTDKPVHCFGVSFDVDLYDERAHAIEAAEYANAIFHPVRVTQEDLVRALPDAVYYSEGLAINGQLSAKFLLSKAVHEAGFKVALTGEGADELFWGYPHLRRDWFQTTISDPKAQNDALRTLVSGNVASAGIMMPGSSEVTLDSVRELLNGVPSWMVAKAELGQRIQAVLSPDYWDSFSNRNAFSELLGHFDIGNQLQNRSIVTQSAYLWARLALANYILKTLGDGTEMAHSVEGRVPFLDHTLYEWVRRLPPELKIQGTVEKYLLRESMRGVVPERVRRRQKHPFLAPPICRFSTPEIHTLVQDVLRSRAFASVPFFDRAQILNWLDRLPKQTTAEQSAQDPVLMTALCASVLQERFGLSEALV